MADGARLVRTDNERAMMVAHIIERYVTEHPRAADTTEGIRSWWVTPECYGASREDVQAALDYLVELGRMSRVVIAGGAAIYAAAATPRETATKGDCAAGPAREKPGRNGIEPT
jgi:hypothetical protein